MNANYSKLLPKITAIMGLMSIALLTTIPSPAKEVRNPRPNIFNEPPYNRGSKPSETAPVAEPSQPVREVPTAPVSKPTQSTSVNLVTLLEKNESFKTLAKALKAAGLTETLQGKGLFTIFAPTDAAFAKLPADALKDLLKPENKEVLVKILTYHVVSGKVLSTDLKSGEVKTVEGGAINVKVDPVTGVTVNDAKVTQADIQGSNGVVHAIDNVILPPDL
ncbi:MULTISPECIES: fasciclin domain-containing protein [Aphanizomenon]|jgi:uncharacterized surface protein with fasciclin (FAS1) repeats|uniref:fasciclin domain-containing protein n=1 Tax=Aphanizomenon TaxID=1175 RepID=UPI000543E2B4|nr:MULTISPECIES: fasciclin domain-containing protein [Aphanizomenon]KHG42719.1 beta-Ig-H3/fasciclin [Aphanizomenon flos-aquae 2012/KM1/D3]MTJ31515.1 fasciclin domain-containing protein [Aphanizomenon sp. UHCC 0183]QSV70340.1 MAG: fasciclin domain-containing protein [Aphanizomenon flos-aquae KM1D3_PB]